MDDSGKSRGAVLAQCALKRKARRRLEDKNSQCVVHVRLSEPMSAWNMDHKDIKDAAQKIKRKRCDFAIRQNKNPVDEKSHLVLVECKRRLRGNADEMEGIGKQLAGGLAVLRHLAGDAGFRCDKLMPMLVSPNYDGGTDTIRRELWHRPIEYNGRQVRIRAVESGVEIDDRFVATKGVKKK